MSLRDTLKASVARSTVYAMQHATFSLTDATASATTLQPNSPRPQVVGIGNATGYATKQQLIQKQDATLLVQTSSSCCVDCSHISVFGNCTKPIEAGLSKRFMLIAHPKRGAGCHAFEPCQGAFRSHVT